MEAELTVPGQSRTLRCQPAPPGAPTWSRDYSCFAIPAAIDTAVCPDTVPQATMACDVPECTLCNLAGNYADSSGAAKVGYCVCGEPNGDGERSWTCASDTAWPCPGGSGC